ncbi:zinc finger, CCHC-type containing protein [Tanacetum coccineum]
MDDAAMKHMASNFAKLDKFEGVDFRRWKKKMHFLLSSISVVYVLTTLIPENGDDDATVEQTRKRAKCDNDNYVCKGLILNGMSNSLFDIYQNVKSSKELWDSLEAKYMAEDASSKKFLVSNFTNYKVTNSRPVMEQHNELLGILSRFTQHKMNMDEAIQVSCIIDKLPPSWKDFKHTLKHKKEELTLVELGSHLRIEESLRAQDSDKPKGNNVVGPQLNIVNNIGKSAFMSTFKLNDSIICYLCDLNVSPSLGNQKYFVTFIDDASRTNRGGEYMDTLYFHSVGIIHEMTTPYIPQQNGISERKNRVVKEMVNSMLSYSGLSQGFWGEAMAVVRLPNPKLKTLGERGIECVFVGYAEHSKAFSFYVNEPNDSVSINSIIESRDAIFDDNRFSSVPRPSQRSLVNGTKDIGCSVVPEEEQGMRLQIGCKWIFKRKLKVDGTIKKFKARLVIQGFKQKSEIDYFDSYAPVARISTIRLLIIMTSIHNLIIHQMDVKTTFLNAYLDEEVYMNQPQGFIMTGNENKVCKLIKSLYGLKQAPKQWHQKFDEVVLSNGYLLNQADKCVYSKFDETGKGVIICLYVDDMLIFGTNQVQVDLTKEFLSSRFSMKDIREADVILGIRIKHESNGIAISQSHYIEKAIYQLEFSRVIGCLMYDMTCTRPDIAFAVGKLSRYTSNPGTQQWQAIQRVLKYLKKTMDYRLTYTGYPSVLEGYTDTRWIGNIEDNSSTSGWVFLLGGAAISIRCDSAATLEKTYSQMYNEKSRNLGVRHSMIRELITNGVVSIEFVRLLKVFAGLPHATASISDIVDLLIPISKIRSSRSVIAKLVVAALTYFIWQERNWRLFKKQKRTYKQVIDCIKLAIRLKLLSCCFKKSKDGMMF